MAWIESHESLPNHPKTKRMCRILKITPVEAVGHLHFLWWWAMNHAQDGSLDRYRPDDIADACAWSGEAGIFFQALVEAEFIDKKDSGYYIHDWHDYAGKLIAIRQKDAERKRKSRGKESKSSSSPSDVHRTSKGNLTESIRDLNLDLNQDLIKDTTTANPFKIYESEGFGMLTEVTGQKIGDLIDEFGERWVCEAMKEASYYSRRTLPYVKSILNRYRTSGIDEPWKSGDKNGRTKEGVRQGERTGIDKSPSDEKSGLLPSKWSRRIEDDVQVS